MLRAMIEDEAWPSAQAFTSWAKSVTVSPSILRSTVTVEPHSLEWAVAVASGLRQPADPGNIAGQFEDPAVVDLVQHGVRLGRLMRARRLIAQARCERIYRGWIGGREQGASCAGRFRLAGEAMYIMGMRRPAPRMGASPQARMTERPPR